MPDYHVRRATVADAATIARHRVRMFQDMGDLTLDETPPVESAAAARLTTQLASGHYIGWVIEQHGAIVAGAGVLLHETQPTRANLDGRPTAHVLNVYTEPAHRRQGLAHQLVAEILAWARAEGLPRVSLHASRLGRSVYERLGFRASNEMRIDLRS